MMTNSTKLMLALSLSAGMMLSGCKGAPPAAAPGTPAVAGTPTTNPDGSVTNPDGSVTYPAGTAQARTAQGTRNADGSITNPDGSVTYPAGTSKVAAVAPPPPPVAAPVQRPAPASAAPRPPAAVAAAPRVVQVPAGTQVAVSISQALSASQNNVGDSFSGVLAQPIESSDGAVLFRRGTRVEGTVTAAKGRGRFKGAGDLAVALVSIGGQRVSTNIVERTQSGKGKRTAGIIGGGTGLGAIIGGLAGGGKGALIGGLAGAGAGTAGAAYTGNKDVVIPAETVLTFQLAEPLSVR
ncbi:MAG: hypothetical protein JWM43_1164 [Acidobacteriaceae bacterium]|nr:hypothetical protein [Acidobacteriaceae bacterium]